ncbi:hypothetical protein HZS_339, partial [Henneguya salminicola]
MRATMLRTSSRVKKTRGGNVFKEVKEHYLRKTIPCGVSGCQQCKPYMTENAVIANNCGWSNLFPTSHFLIPEFSVLIKQIDLFENDKICNVIVLQTVLHQIRQTNIGVYKRLQSIINISEKYFYVFNNECHVETFVDQQRGESDLEWENKLFTKACEWYSRHIETNLPEIGIVAIYSHTSPRSNYFTKALTVQDYVKSLIWYDELIDSLVIEDNIIAMNSLLESSTSFPDHISLNVLNLGLKTKKYLSGIFYQSPDNFTAGTVKIRNSTEIYNVLGLINMNRAFTDDFVAIEVISEISETPGVLLIDEGKDFCIPSSDKIETVSTEDKYCRVVGIIRRNWKQYCGIVFSNTPAENFFLFRSMDSRIPLVIFESKRIESIRNKKICISIDGWGNKFKYPRGHFVKILGDIGDKNVESESILFERRIPFQKFSKCVIDCLPDISDSAKNDQCCSDIEKILQDNSKRMDLRHLTICSIDPPGCTDIDDAIHCRLVSSDLGNEIYELGIHIADVTHYVLPGTHLDREAYRRGTTVYLVDRRIDMLPELLSSNLCSLRPNEDRLAFSVLYYIDNSGNLVESHPPLFTKSVIRSRSAFTYSEAQCILDDQNDLSEISVMLKKIAAITKHLRMRRLSRGALTLETSEVRFEIDSETLEPIELNLKESLETNKLIEDCMLLANVLVGRKIYETYPNLAILRCHPRPSPDALKQLFDLVSKRLGLSHTYNVDNLAAFLDSATSSNDPYVNRVVRVLSILCLQQASYICSGCHAFDTYFHYGLAEPLYTHFTSPIRRYPDILVHRLLAAAIQNSNSSIISFYDSKTMQQMCEHLNRRHISAQIASRESIKLQLYFYIKNKYAGNKQETAYITKLHQNAISVYVPSYHYHGVIQFDPNRIESLGSTINVKAGFIESIQHKLNLGVFSKILVNLKINPNIFCSSGIKISLIDPPIPGI